jgi:hypothetical protein
MFSFQETKVKERWVEIAAKKKLQKKKKKKKNVKVLAGFIQAAI